MTAATGTVYGKFLEAYREMDNPKKNASNPAFKSKYANLEEMLSVTRPILAAAGFALVQEPVANDGHIGVHTRAIHESGEELDFGAYTVPLARADAQGAGSAITYTRRYAIAAIFGLAQEDDDGIAAAAPHAARPIPAPAPISGDPGAVLVTFGSKHNGETIAAISVSDPGYVAWLANQDGSKPAFAAAKAWLAGEKPAPLPLPADEPPDYTDSDIPF